MKRSQILAVLSTLATFFSVSSVEALNVQLLRPTTGHAKGYQLFTSDTLPKYQFAAGLNINYAHQPLEQIIAGTTRRTAGVVDHFVTADFLLSYGITDWLNLSVDMPVNIYHNIAPTLVPARDTGYGDAGDLMATLKIRIFDASKTSTGLGLAVVPFITAPTGDAGIFFGDSSITGGGILVGDAQWKSNRFYMNVGTRARERENLGNLVVNEELIYGLGFTRPLVKDWDFNLIIEAFGSTNFSKFSSENISTPVEVIGVLQKKWLENRRLITHLGGGAALTNGYGGPDYRITTGVSYAWDLKPEHKPVAVIREEVITTNKIHFAYDKYEIKPSSHTVLDEIIATIQSKRVVEVRVEGHTDSRGTDAYNQKLSENRANSVRNYMVGHGIPAEKIGAVGMGESKPIADNATKEGRAQNRRVEFHLKIAEGSRVKVRESSQAAPTYEEGDSSGGRRR
jgi:outer membrane protein OmpA-like peptidoglycan-associated protein